MKTILIATDFSKASRNASLYGVELAKALDAKIILFSAYEVPKPPPGLGVSVSRYDIMMQTDKRLLEESDFLDPKREFIEIMCDEGAAKDAIINIAKEKKADFIIAGMKGSGKTLKKIFGSTATSLINKSDIPVIAVPEYGSFSVPKTILCASDIMPDTNIEHLDQIKAITETFESKLYVVTVVSDKYAQTDAYAQIFEQIHTPGDLSPELKKLDTTFQYPVDSNIRHALNEFARKHDVDILVMAPHKRGWLERLFIKSETKDMIFHTHIPILVIPDKDFKESSSIKKREQNLDY
jgi:nucleotide-binding universal stress UspA family protein